MMQASIEDLEDILDEEYNCLLRGDLQTLLVVMARKEEALDAFQNHPVGVEAEVSGTISGKAERNQKLLASAAAGMRSVLRRLHELRSIGDGSGTYQANGLRHQKLARTGGLSRRA